MCACTRARVCVWCFERSNGLDTALYQNIPLPFYLRLQSSTNTDHMVMLDEFAYLPHEGCCTLPNHRIRIPSSQSVLSSRSSTGGGRTSTSSFDKGQLQPTLGSLLLLFLAAPTLLWRHCIRHYSPPSSSVMDFIFCCPDCSRVSIDILHTSSASVFLFFSQAAPSPVFVFRRMLGLISSDVKTTPVFLSRTSL